MAIQTITLKNGQSYDISGGGITEVTYAALKSLRDGGNLSPGAFYRITDYVTKVIGYYDLSVIQAQGYLHYGKSAEHPFDIIVQAVDSSHLNENARAALHSGDTYFATQDLGAWELKYCIDNDTTRFGFADATNGKGVIWWMKDEWNNEAGYDFKNWQFVRYALKLADATADYNPSDTGLVYNSSTQPNRYGSMYHVYMALQGYMQSQTYVNPFVQKYKGTEVNNYDFAVGGNILGCVNPQFTEIDATYLSSFAADLYYTFDYYDVTNGVHKDASFNYEDLVQYQSQDVGIVCRDNCLQVEADMLYANLMNNYSIIGVGGTCWEVNETYLSTHLYTGYIFGNSIDKVCYCNTFGSRCYGNVLKTFCYSNTFGDSCYSNTFGYNCNSNTFGDSCYSNTFGDSCNSNTFGDSCNSNTFGVLNQNNELIGYIRYLESSPHVIGVTVTTTQVPQYTGLARMENYNNGTSGYATIMIKTGYNTETAVSTTDGGNTWA